MDSKTLLPGDVLLYKPTGLFGRIIALKTWHKIAHCECYVGNGNSVASRDGKGVNIYPLRLTDLAYILRPTQPLDLVSGLRWFHKEAKGLPYGWLDLAQFIGRNVNGKGMVCSPFLTYFLRACKLPIFNDEPAEKIAPFQFILSELLDQVWPK